MVRDDFLLSDVSPHHALIDRVRSTPTAQRLTLAQLRVIVGDAIQRALRRAIDLEGPQGRDDTRSRA
jgi:hypothetical protein